MPAMPLPGSLQKSVEATKVDYVQLGSSGLRVSVPIFGTMGIGSDKWLPWVLNEDESLEILKTAYDRGINTWDTADMYSNGMSEEIIGKAIKKFSIPREKVVLMTKCWAYVAEDPSVFGAAFSQQMSQSKDYVNRGGECLSRTTDHRP
jgi:aryl-alcohol dehydrogenase-like predicted oxidoreductase